MNSHFFYVAPIVGHETGQFTPFLISIRAKLPARYQPSGSSGVVFWQKACLLAFGYQGPFCVNEMWSRWHVWCLFLPDHVSFVREKCCPGEMAHCSSTQLTFLSLWADTYYYDTTNSCLFLNDECGLCYKSNRTKNTLFLSMRCSAPLLKYLNYGCKS